MDRRRSAETVRGSLQQAVLIVAILFATTAALAASVEIKVRTMLREKPTSAARIVDRLPAGKKVPMIGQSDDGNWVHIRANGHEGWVQAAAIKGMRAPGSAGEESAEEAADDEEAKPLAKRRGVRPEAWVSKSRYHEGEETKL